MFSLSNRTGLSEIITRNFPRYFFAGEDGAATGVGTADVGASGTDAKSEVAIMPDVPVPESFLKGYMEKDPEYAEVIKKENDFKKDKSSAKDQVDKNADTDELSGKADESKADDGKEKSETDTLAEETSGDENENDLEFADNVIEGLKGEHLKALPKEAKLALAEYYGKTSELQKEHTALKERLEKLSADPVVKMREEMVKEGRDRFDVRGITATEKSAIVDKIRQTLDMNDAEAQAIFAAVEESVETVSKAKAEDMVNNSILEEAARKKVDETVTNGRNVFLKLGTMNKSLAFKETDGNKFWLKDEKDGWKLNEKHPEIKLYKEKILPIIDVFGKAGIKYDTLINLEKDIGIKGIYAMVAAKLGLPVAINTGERDSKMIQSELRKKLQPFLRGSSSDELSAGSGKPRQVTGSTMKNGYDITKLATDAAYYERAIDSKPGNLEHAELVANLAAEGDAYIKKQTKK